VTPYILPSTKGEGGKFLSDSPPELVQPTEGHLHHWRNVQPYWSAKKAFRSDTRAVPMIVGEFLKSCGNCIQVNCLFSPVLESSHWKAKMDWICGARWMQKNASLRARQEKELCLSWDKDQLGLGPQGVK
jgi:hypothetical protein